VQAEGLSVREVERRVAAQRTPASTKAGGKTAKGGAGDAASAATGSVPAGASSAVVRQLEERLRRRLQTSVSIALTAKDKGEVRIAFYSNDDLERVLELLGVSLD